jgi:hypothetical protein
MTYRVKFYDIDGGLVFWYSTSNRTEAYKLATQSKNWYAEVEPINA